VLFYTTVLSPARNSLCVSFIDILGTVIVYYIVMFYMRFLVYDCFNNLSNDVDCWVRTEVNNGHNYVSIHRLII